MNRLDYIIKNPRQELREELLFRKAQLNGCPKCHGEQICGCKACLERVPGRDKEVTWKWPDGDTIACGHCGFTMSADDWQDRDWQYSKIVEALEKIEGGKAK